MTKAKMKVPKTLGTPGKTLWKRIASTSEIDGCEELLEKLCATEDRLSQVRDAIAKSALLVRGDKGVIIKNPLLDLELRLTAQFGRIWKLLGLADPPDEQKRPVGRPTKTESEARWRG